MNLSLNKHGHGGKHTRPFGFILHSVFDKFSRRLYMHRKPTQPWCDIVHNLNANAWKECTGFRKALHEFKAYYLTEWLYQGIRTRRHDTSSIMSFTHGDLSLRECHRSCQRPQAFQMVEFYHNGILPDCRFFSDSLVSNFLNSSR